MAKRQSNKSSAYLPNSERYRPKTLSEVVGQRQSVEILQRFVKNFHEGKPTMPHLLFTGPPGCGKTSAAFALARDLFGEDWRLNFMEMNTSDDRGIDVVRDQIKAMAEVVPIGQPFRIIFLDEGDGITHDAQMALKRVIEGNVSNCRFIVTANEGNRIAEAVRDRLVHLPFQPVADEDALKLLARAAFDQGQASLNGEHNPTKEGLLALYEMCGRSMRSSLDTLQALGEDFDLSKLPKQENHAPDILTFVHNGRMEEAERAAIKWIRSGVSMDNVFKNLFNEVIVRGGNPWRLGEYERAVRAGNSFELQIRCWLWEVKQNGVQG